jgi:hypothetical protein
MNRRITTESVAGAMLLNSISSGSEHHPWAAFMATETVTPSTLNPSPPVPLHTRAIDMLAILRGPWNLEWTTRPFTRAI